MPSLSPANKLAWSSSTIRCSIVAGLFFRGANLSSGWNSSWSSCLLSASYNELLQFLVEFAYFNVSFKWFGWWWRLGRSLWFMGVISCCCRRFLTLRFWGLLVAFLQQTLRRQTHRLNNSNHLITITNFFIFITLHDQEGNYENREVLILNKFFPSASLKLRKFNIHPGSIQYCFHTQKKIVTLVQYTCLRLVKLTTWWNHTSEKTLYFRKTNSKKRENSTWKKRQRAVRRGSWVENERTRKQLAILSCWVKWIYRIDKKRPFRTFLLYTSRFLDYCSYLKWNGNYQKAKNSPLSKYILISKITPGGNPASWGKHKVKNY